jgi:Amt family ammonium transporter
MSGADDLDAAVLRNLLVQTTREYERQRRELQAEKEFAQVTLASIGDGVLATDSGGKVRYLNPVAESLTGWSAAHAVGRPLGEVLHLSDEAQGRGAATLVAGCLERGLRHTLSERVKLVRRDGQRYAVEGALTPIRDPADGIVGAVFIFRDVSDRRLMALQLAHQASHDELTGLLNRQTFDTHVERALAEVHRGEAEHTLCYLDLDGFKLVNDSCGHLAGDELLRAVTRLLKDTLPATDYVARLGGDEFGILLCNAASTAAVERIRVFHRALGDYRFAFRDQRFTVGASLGLAPLSVEISSVAQALSAADHACYVAKERGRNRIELYRHDDDAFSKRHGEISWVGRIQQIVEAGDCRLFAQPIRPISPRAAPGLFLEILLRIRGEGGKLDLPGDFLRAAERFGLMRTIDRWVIGETLAAIAGQPPGFLDQLATCSINLSATSLADDDLADFVLQEITDKNVPAGKICFEITETAAIENLPLARRLFARLCGCGIRFALDDFGAGMSSYGYLKEIPVSFLKIDGRFTQEIVTDPLDRAMVESIHQVGRAIGIETVAEAVASAAILEQVEALGVDYAQGFWLGHPRPFQEAVAEVPALSGSRKDLSRRP